MRKEGNHSHPHERKTHSHTYLESVLDVPESCSPVDSLADGINLGEGARDALQLFGRQEARGAAANQQLALVRGAKEGLSA